MVAGDKDVERGDGFVNNSELVRIAYVSVMDVPEAYDGAVQWLVYLCSFFYFFFNVVLSFPSICSIENRRYNNGVYIASHNTNQNDVLFIRTILINYH